MDKSEINKIGEMFHNVDNWKVLREVLTHLWEKTEKAEEPKKKK